MSKFCFIAASSFNLNRRLPIMQALIADGHEVIAASPYGEEHPILLDHSIKTFPIGFARGSSNLIQDLKVMLSLIFLFIRERPDLVHNFTIKPNIFGTLAAKIAGVRFVVCSVTGLGFNPTISSEKTTSKKLAVTFFAKFISKLANVVITQNQDDSGYLIEKGARKNKFHLIPGSGVNVTKFRPPTPEERRSVRQTFVLEDKICILFVGRLLKNKGVYELIEAIQTLSKVDSTICLLLVGSPDPSSGGSLTEDEIKDFKSENIRFLGEDEDVVKYYWAADIFCLPSYNEGFPGATLEAMACGLPVVTTDTSGCRETVIEGKSGYLVAVNSSRGLVTALNALKSDTADLRAMGCCGRLMSLERFSNYVIVKLHCELYSKFCVANSHRKIDSNTNS